jgi:hypothetical protein
MGVNPKLSTTEDSEDTESKTGLSLRVLSVLSGERSYAASD